MVSYYAQKKSQNQIMNFDGLPRIAISQKLQELHLYFSLLLCMIYINNRTESRRYDYRQVVPDAVRGNKQLQRIGEESKDGKKEV